MPGSHRTGPRCAGPGRSWIAGAAGPALLPPGLQQGLAGQELDGLDARLSSLAALDDRLQDFQAVKVVTFEAAAVDRQRFLDSRVCRQLERRTPLRQRHRAPRHQRHAIRRGDVRAGENSMYVVQRLMQEHPTVSLEVTRLMGLRRQHIERRSRFIEHDELGFGHLGRPHHDVGEASHRALVD